MNMASLFSGGKDSTYSTFLAENQGHTIKCLLTVFPKSDESHLLHHPNILWTKLQSQSMQLPQIVACADSEGIGDEAAALEDILLQAKDDFDIEGLVHGGISSKFQKTQFETLCKRCGLEVLSPVWGSVPSAYMSNLLESGFEYVITSVSSGGLDDSWLGRKVTKDDVETLASLSARHGFNMNFEGGEAETFVTNCPLFSRPIEISRGRRLWDGYRGRFEILDARLTSNA